ncbi:MAG: pseudouridine synthase [Solirubrobacteraceae bacterium]
MRLGKYLAHAGVASRRAAEQLVRTGHVSVDSAIERDPARDISEGNAVALDGRVLHGEEPRVVYALHKPAGVVSTAADTHGRPTVTSLVPGSARLYPVGRLDAQSTGLILLTNDGELANLLTHPRYGVPKCYRAQLSGGRPSAEAIAALEQGIELDDGPTAPARIRRIGSATLEIELREGRKRQVRRMCEAIGHPVLALERVRFGPLKLDGLAPGESRQLTPDELNALRASVV